ncbi:uncharacterized protein LAESUDRAFT_715322 [Laetiporus sulphureus 93-53]|uniref:Uncharacterized protein n=1 Tax=Laetiporus sulphureus 93-53 TaxID=1314785 RepID=A0A165DF87_9APHY|nr:uncharacterized protein LAESUDRAFT_715322 [Laetiporus sulphureus 93-53]KZT04765.1 hypothetical protein LAESUDRAFT_715322 [Laetiporus sulphureus 93-53]
MFSEVDCSVLQEDKSLDDGGGVASRHRDVVRVEMGRNSSVSDVTDVNTTGGAEMTDADGVEATETGDAEVTKAGSVEMTEAGGAEMTDTGSVETTDADGVGVSDLDSSRPGTEDADGAIPNLKLASAEGRVPDLTMPF